MTTFTSHAGSNVCSTIRIPIAISLTIQSASEDRVDGITGSRKTVHSARR